MLEVIQHCLIQELGATYDVVNGLESRRPQLFSVVIHVLIW
jgi:hypothetical protein